MTIDILLMPHFFSFLGFHQADREEGGKLNCCLHEFDRINRTVFKITESFNTRIGVVYYFFFAVIYNSSLAMFFSETKTVVSVVCNLARNISKSIC